MDFLKIGYRDELFIIVQQTSQVFYFKDPMIEHWYVILHEKKKGDTIDDIENGDPRSFTSIIMNKDDDVDDDAHATRVNHIEGIYI